jgi:hypothetical protein
MKSAGPTDAQKEAEKAAKAQAAQQKSLADQAAAELKRRQTQDASRGGGGIGSFINTGSSGQGLLKQFLGV